MNVLTYNPDGLTKNTVIPLGKACECRATRIDFTVGSWLARFPGGEIVLYVKDPNGEMYLATITTADGMTSWVLRNTDTQVPGYGSLELALIGANGEKKLSAVATTKLDTSLVESEDAEYMQPWIERAAEIQADTELAAKSAATYAAIASEGASNAVEAMDAADMAREKAEVAADAAEDAAQAAQEAVKEAEAAEDAAAAHAADAARSAQGTAAAEQAAAERAQEAADSALDADIMAQAAADYAQGAEDSAQEAAAHAAAAEAVLASIPEDYADLSDLVAVAVKTVTTTSGSAENLELVYKTDCSDGLTVGGVDYDGSTMTATSNAYVVIDVQPGDKITAKGHYTKPAGTSHVGAQSFKAVCAYNGDTVVPEAGKSKADSNVTTYTVPDGITRVALTIASYKTMGTSTWLTYEHHIYIDRNNVLTETNTYRRQDEYGAPLRWTGDLAAGEIGRAGVENVGSNKVTAFCCRVSAMGVLRIGEYSSTGVNRPYVEVTATHVNVYPGTGEAHDWSYAHGLTIGADLQVIIEQGRSMYLDKLIVQTGGNRYEANTSSLRFGAALSGLAVYAVSGSYTSCALSVSIKDINRPVWVFGDSWISVGYPERWTAQAVELGLDKWLLSGYAGATSEAALKGFKALLAIRAPKMAVWCLGMNDADTDDTTPNKSWLACLTEVQQLCAARDITLILYTVPTTATRNNNAKNAYVRASGHRYIDAVAAMGADEAGNWISGYVSSDGNHTTVAGARALMARVFADVPELAYSLT